MLMLLLLLLMMMEEGGIAVYTTVGSANMIYQFTLSAHRCPFLSEFQQ
jgi:hypothetical protein